MTHNLTFPYQLNPQELEIQYRTEVKKTTDVLDNIVNAPYQRVFHYSNLLEGMRALSPPTRSCWNAWRCEILV